MSLKSKVLRGGLYLVVREGIGMAISLGGVVLLTKEIGPQHYGLYAAAYGIFYYFQNLSQLGVGTYLVRKEGEEEQKVYHQAFTLLLLLAVAAMSIAFIGYPLLESWLKIKGFRSISQVLVLGLPIVLLQQVPLAKLERQLDYKQVASIELAGQAAYFAVALPLAFQGCGAWSPVAGWWFQQVQTLGLLYWRSHYRPRLYWQWELIKPMFIYSVTLSASSWGWQLRNLVNPLIVGRFAGVEAVAFVALANRMVETLSFARTATFRISIAALAQLQGDRRRLERAVTEGIGLQVLALGPLLVGVAWLGPWVIPALFGEEWRSAMAVYPFIALSSLTNSVFSMHSATLYVLSRNLEVTLYHLIYIALFAGAAFVLVPRLGLVGYGWAEITTIASYLSLHYYLVREMNSPDYRLVGLWWGAFAIALFEHQLGWWTILGLVAVALLPQTRYRISDYIKTIRGGVRAS